LTVRNHKGAALFSVPDIGAKERLRADFAASSRRLEMNAEHMNTKMAEQLAAIGKKTDGINCLRKELKQKTEALSALESRDKNVRDQVRAAEEQTELKSISLRDRERALADTEVGYAKTRAQLGEQLITVDSRRVELAALRTQVEALRSSITNYERVLRTTEEHLAHERSGTAAVMKGLGEVRTKIIDLAAHAGELEQRILMRSTAIEVLRRREPIYEILLGDGVAQISEHEVEMKRLRGDIKAARQTESELRDALEAAQKTESDLRDGAIDALRKAEGDLRNARIDCSELERQVETIKHDEDCLLVENVVLRERIMNFAAQVAWLTALREGPDSQILCSLDSKQLDKDTIANFIRLLRPSASHAA
jgi:chromosome segregation ATPase